MPVKKYKADDQVLYFSKSIQNGRAMAQVMQMGPKNARLLNEEKIPEINGPFNEWLSASNIDYCITVEKLMDLLKDVPC